MQRLDKLFLKSYYLSTLEWLTVLIPIIDPLKKAWSEIHPGRVVSFWHPSIKNNTVSILKSTRVRIFRFSEIIFVHVRSTIRVATREST